MRGAAELRARSPTRRRVRGTNSLEFVQVEAGKVLFAGKTV